LDWRRWLGWGPAKEFALNDARWVVVDVETTGLDVHRDRLLAIGAIGVTGSRLVSRDSFEVVLQQGEASSAANILVHRITGAEQRGGEAPDRALDAFMQFAEPDRTAGCVGYHAAFDEAMIKRACKAHGCVLPATLLFLDLADLAPALLPGVLPAKAPLDDWLAHFGIHISRRHHAVADALGTAQLFLQLRALALAQGLTTSANLFELIRAQRWLGRGA
jgi:DNA polymerase-3 subunit epsilon